MTNKNEMPDLKNCPFKRGQVWENPDGEIMMVQHVRKTISGLHEVMYVTEDAEQGIFMEDCKEVVENIIMVDTRTAEPQPPVIEGLNKSITWYEHEGIDADDPNRNHRMLEPLYEAARLYAQGQTAQPVDLGALHITQEMLDRPVKHKPRLAALLKGDGVAPSVSEFEDAYKSGRLKIRNELTGEMEIIKPNPSEDAQRALGVLDEVLAWAEVGVQSAPRGTTIPDLNDAGITIRAALAQKVGE